MIQNQIPLEKMLEKYGKICLERDMAFDRIAFLEQEIEKYQAAKVVQPDLKPVGAASRRD